MQVLELGRPLTCGADLSLLVVILSLLAMTVQSNLPKLRSDHHRLNPSDELIFPQGLIPGGENFVLYPVTNSSYTWVADVKEGTSLIFFMTDSQGRQSGTSALLKVGDSTDASCLNTYSPSSTASAPSQTSGSTSSGSHSSTINVGIGFAVAATIIVLLTSSVCLKKRRAARSSNVAVRTPIAYVTTLWYP
jgi:hypothetical protein